MLVAGTLIAVAAPVGAAEAHRGRRGKRGCAKMLLRAPTKKLKKRLGLSPAQVTQLKQLKRSFITQAIPLKGKIKMQRFEIRSLMDNETIDSQKVLAAHKKMNELKGKMKLLKVGMKLKLHTLLKPDQKKKLRRTCRKMRWRRMHRRGRRYGMMKRRWMKRRWMAKHRGFGRRGWKRHRRHDWKRRHMRRHWMKKHQEKTPSAPSGPSTKPSQTDL